MIDYINVRANNTVVSRQYLADSNKAVADHTDFIQLIPTAEYCDRAQYALAQLIGVIVHDCALYSSTTMHGITGFDGLFSDINIAQVVFNTRSPHKVTFNGLLSGSFAQLHNGAKPGEHVRVLLDNARIGGVPQYGSQLHYCNVLHFHPAPGIDGTSPMYEPVQYDDTVQLVDRRGECGMLSGRGTVVNNLVNFNLPLFRKLCSRSELRGLGVQEQCMAYQELALTCGDSYE